MSVTKQCSYFVLPTHTRGCTRADADDEDAEARQLVLSRAD